jgi:hypothetical protein
MTEDRIAAIRARLEAATPGPWNTSGPDTVAQWMIYDGRWCVASATAYDHNMPLSNKPGARGPGYIDPDANAEFIAHAPEDIAWLIGQLEGQRAKLTAISRQAKAEAWDEGYRSGQRDHCDYWPSAETCNISSANPYRTKE